MRHNQYVNKNTHKDKLGMVGFTLQNWLCRNANARHFLLKSCDMVSENIRNEKFT